MALVAITLPPGWMDRTVQVQGGNTGGHRGLCLDPHDLAVSELDASSSMPEREGGASSPPAWGGTPRG